MKNDIGGKIPPGLRTWFLIHFFVDMLFAIPLLFFPEVIMPWFGWEYVDPVMSRLVGAALLGIGGESLFSRTAALDTYRALLRLKIIWASGAILALFWVCWEGALLRPGDSWQYLLAFWVFGYITEFK